jgi:hypothetical protein
MGWQIDDMEDRPLKGTSDWVTVVVTVDVPEDASSLFGGIALVGSGTISMMQPLLLPLEIGNEQSRAPRPIPTGPAK